MYSVLLVEDEEIIRKGIRNSIPWEEFGCRVIGEAGNGEEGRRLIEELKVIFLVLPSTKKKNHLHFSKI